MLANKTLEAKTEPKVQSTKQGGKEKDLSLHFFFMTRSLCVCDEGWTGPECDTELGSCISTPCAHGGTCHPQPSGYNCTCPTGYMGESPLYHIHSSLWPHKSLLWLQPLRGELVWAVWEQVTLGRMGGRRKRLDGPGSYRLG